MAAIDFPFAASGTRRVPTADELLNGYTCGPLDRPLDDFMRWWLSGQADGAITSVGLTTDDADLMQLARAVRLRGGEYVASIGGTANALTGTLNPAPAAWSDLVGVPLRMVIANANTGAATLNLNGLGTKAIVDYLGYALSGGELKVGAIVTAVYNGTHLRIVSGAEIVPSHFKLSTTTFAIPNNTFSGINTYTTDYSKLRGSTLSASGITIGADDAGLWEFVFSGNTNGAQSTYTEIGSIYLNGNPLYGVHSHTTATAANESSIMDVTMPKQAKLAVGDVVATVYLQANSASSSTFMAAEFTGIRIRG